MHVVIDAPVAPAPVVEKKKRVKKQPIEPATLEPHIEAKSVDPMKYVKEEITTEIPEVKQEPIKTVEDLQLKVRNPFRH